MTDEKNYDVLAAESVAKAVRGSHLVEAVSLTLKYFDGSGLSEKKREYLAMDLRSRIGNILDNALLRLDPDWDEENALPGFDPAMWEVPGIAGHVAMVAQVNCIGDDDDEEAA